MKFILTIFALLISTGIGLAKPILLSELSDYKELGTEYYNVYEDSTNVQALQQICQNPSAFSGTIHYLKNFNSTYWIRYSFKNNTSSAKTFLLEFVDPHIEQITFFKALAAKGQQQGYLEAFDTKSVQHKNHVYEISIPSSDSLVCYFKLRGTSNITFATKLQSIRYFTYYSLHEYFILGLYYGFLIIMTLYNLVLYLFTKMSLRIYYALYVISAALNSLSEDGMGFQFFWPDFPIINFFLSDYLPILFLGVYIIYALRFLDVLQKPSRFKTIMIALFTANSIFHIGVSYYNISPRFWLPLYILPFVMISHHSGTLLLRDKKKEMRFLFIGTILIVLNYLIFFLRMSAWIENTFVVVYFFNFTIAIEVILFSIAIGDKLRSIENENLENKELIIKSLQRNEELKNKVNRELEEKVNERTRDLQAAKLLLEEQAREINAMNAKLDLQNWKLTEKVVEVSKKRIHGSEIDPQEFQELYPNQVTCFQLLEEIKWVEGFACRKCANKTFTNGATFRSRRCTKCGVTETPTAHTIFHGLKIPIEKAFYIFALVVQSKGEISSSDLEKKSGVNQKACWSFKQKISERILAENNSFSSWTKLIYKN